MEGVESVVEYVPQPIDPVLCSCYRTALGNEFHRDVECHIVRSLSGYTTRVLPDVISDVEVDCAAFRETLDSLVATNTSLLLKLSAKACDQVGLTSMWAERAKWLSASPLRLLSSDDAVHKALGLGRTLALLCAASSLDSRARQLRQSNAQKESPSYLAMDVLQPLLTLCLRKCGAEVLVDAVESKAENSVGAFPPPQLHPRKVLLLICSSW